MQVVIVGAGSVAESLTAALVRVGLPPIAIYNRSREKAERIASIYSPASDIIDSLEELPRNADLYIFTLSDPAIAEVAAKMPTTSGVWVHTAAAVSLEVLTHHHKESAVWYPFNTFSPGLEVNLAGTYFFIEGNTEESTRLAEQLTERVKGNAMHCGLEERRLLHVGGVFSCNFVNHLFTLTQELLAKGEIPFQIMRPLIQETFRKAQLMSPKQAQTGPAKRHNKETIQAHEATLSSKAPELLPLYQLLTQSIWNTYPQQESSTH